jgi:hypothetical protein
MKRQIDLSLKQLSFLSSGRVQLFNKKFYRLEFGKVIRQVPMYENGQLQFLDFGGWLELKKIFREIKLLFSSEGKLLGKRLSSDHTLHAIDSSVWVHTMVDPAASRFQVMVYYAVWEAAEEQQWLKDIEPHGNRLVKEMKRKEQVEELLKRYYAAEEREERRWVKQMQEYCKAANFSPKRT